MAAISIIAHRAGAAPVDATTTAALPLHATNRKWSPGPKLRDGGHAGRGVRRVRHRPGQHRGAADAAQLHPDRGAARPVAARRPGDALRLPAQAAGGGGALRAPADRSSWSAPVPTSGHVRIPARVRGRHRTARTAGRPPPRTGWSSSARAPPGCRR